MNVLARNGSRNWAHSGPCSVMRGLFVVKYFWMSSSGGGGLMSDWQKEEVVA